MYGNFDLLAKRLAPYYSYFRVANRLLFTGHSHQAWPDIAFEGQKEAFMCAANKLDEKWSIVFQKIEKLRNYLRNYYGDEDGYYSFSPNVHELLLRWLSAVDLRRKPKIITTDGEFHTVARQLLRLQEEGIEVVWIPHEPTEKTASRIRQAICKQTAAIICSHVFYRSSLLHADLYKISAIAEEANIPLLIDDYHGTHVVPLQLKRLRSAYVVGGGYKYLQWGEGNCFLRFPKNCTLRPVITGWFASFETLEKGNYAPGQKVQYSEDNMRFAGATYDPSGHFRAARVIDFFEQQHISAEMLRDQYKQQIDYIQTCFLSLDLPREEIRLLHDCSASARGGFLSLHSQHAAQIQRELYTAGVATDVRGKILRFGLAPYIQKKQIKEAMQLLKKIVSKK